MSDIIIQSDKIESYKLLLKQAASLLEGEVDLIANMANISSLVHYTFSHHWTGYYLVRNDDLVVGPFQGPTACTRIEYGKGVCGRSWELKTTVIVDNVHEFEGHIACSSATNSEIVVPLICNEKVIGVFDIDSTIYSAFDDTDRLYLEKLVKLLCA